METTDTSPQPDVSDREYRKLVERAVRMLRENHMDIYTVELRLRVKAFYLIPPHTPDRRAHAYDIAMQAAHDAAGQLDIEIE